MKKVAIFVYSLGGGGAERVALELAIGLKESYEVEIVTLSPTQKYDNQGIKTTALALDDLDSSAFAKMLSL
ncbi:MAG TPA: glycosyltransferase, partial [Campylobacterales bacterium]|nr:glycosyltransferase [Campylobacterales bacterium]